jgi:hypothetical protein
MKKWEAPKLIVLVRSRPEESLVMACKGFVAAGPQENAVACQDTDGGCVSCYNYVYS